MSTPELTNEPSPNLLAAIIAQAPDAIIYADGAGAVRLWNHAAEALFGYAEAEIVGKNLDLIIPERFRAAHWIGFNKAVESGAIRNAGRVLTTRGVRKDGGKIYVDMTFGLVKDASSGVMGVLAMARDCTERHLATRAAQRD